MEYHKQFHSRRTHHRHSEHRVSPLLDANVCQHSWEPNGRWCRLNQKNRRVFRSFSPRQALDLLVRISQRLHEWENMTVWCSTQRLTRVGFQVFDLRRRAGIFYKNTQRETDRSNLDGRTSWVNGRAHWTRVMDMHRHLSIMQKRLR